MCICIYVYARHCFDCVLVACVVIKCINVHEDCERDMNRMRSRSILYVLHDILFTREKQVFHKDCERPDWGVHSKSGRQVCIASPCLLVNFRKASL